MDGGSWFRELTCPPPLTSRTVEAISPQAFAREAETSLTCSRVPHSTVVLLVGEKRDLRRGSTPSLPKLHLEQLDTLVLLPKGTIYLGTQRNTLELFSVQKSLLKV
jgi:hypothetical protein